jgi:hypothetical protein
MNPLAKKRAIGGGIELKRLSIPDWASAAPMSIHASIENVSRLDLDAHAIRIAIATGKAINPA